MFWHKFGIREKHVEQRYLSNLASMSAAPGLHPFLLHFPNLNTDPLVEVSGKHTGRQQIGLKVKTGALNVFYLFFLNQISVFGKALIKSLFDLPSPTRKTKTIN